MKKFLKQGWQRLLLSVLILGLAGCTNPLDLLSNRFSPSDEIGLSGKITVYTPMSDEQTTAYLNLFQKAYPDIGVNLVTISTGDILARLLAERADPQADVVWGLSATSMTLLQWQDALSAYKPEGVERIYVQFRDAETIPYWVGFGAWMSAFCVNMPLLEQLGLPKPESWADIFDPIYEGQIATPSPTTSSTGYMIVEAIFEHFGEVKGWENLDKLDKNVVEYTINNVKPCEMAANGEVAIGISDEMTPIKLAAQGKPVQAIFPSEGTGWDIAANGLVRRDEEKEIAKIFLDWAISDEAIAAYGQTRSLLAMPLAGYLPPPGFSKEPLTLIFDKNFPWASANFEQILTEWTRRYGAKVEGPRVMTD